MSNKQVVLAYHDLVFNQHQPRLAAELYIGAPYTQHNPYASQGKEQFVRHFEAFFREYPAFRVAVKKIVADDDYVFVHVHTKKDTSDSGDAVVDIYRLKDGRIVEHWDVIQKIDSEARNPQAYF